MPAFSNAKWPTRTIGEVAEVLTGLPLSRRADPEGDLYKVINLRDLDEVGRLTHGDELEQLRLVGGSRLLRYSVRQGDVVLTSRGAYMRVALAGRGADGAIASSNLLIIRPNDTLLGQVLLAWLKSPRGEHELLSRSRASAMTIALGRKEVEKVPFPIAPVAVQRQIVDLIQATDAGYRAALEAAEIRRVVGYEVAARLLRGATSPGGPDA